MIRSLITQMLGIEPPTISHINELLDPRGYKLAKENYLRITNIPELFSEFEESRGSCTISTEDLKKEELPREYYQFTAGAIINYELTRRRSFKILIEKEPLLDFLKQGPEKHIYRITKRTMSPEKHEQIADGCSRLKDKIYEEHEKLSKRK